MVGGFGWWEGLEGRGKMAGRKRKTVLYWRRVLREAGIDWTEVERLTSDRKGWKEKVAERMEHLDRWERQKGHGYRWEQGEERLVRNVMRVEGELVCRYEGCGKVCRNKAGLVMHEKRVHRVNEEKGRLKCERCGRGFDAEGQRVSHVRSCTGGAYGGEGDRRQCGGCKRWVSRANYARHVRSCGRVEAGGAVVGGRGAGVRVGRGGQVRMATCGGCGREMRAGNLARHQRGACRVWDPGGGANP